MCGIVGYIGEKQAPPVLMSGLRRLEYRGYDSAGISVLGKDGIVVKKTKGRVQDLQNLLDADGAEGCLGIGHTRWATHGEPSDVNSHPHIDGSGCISVIHNGIIENYRKLREWLEEQGCVFLSQTDTEVIAHLLGMHYDGDMLGTLTRVLPLLEGSFALGILCRHEPDKLFCARKDSPLIAAKAEDGCLIASDIPAVLEHTRRVYLLENMDIAVLERDGVTVFDQFGEPVEREMLHIDWDIEVAEKGGHEHFMAKEIHDQPKALRDTLQPMIERKDGLLAMREDILQMSAEQVKSFKRVSIIACGTAYHAGVVGKYVFERLLRIPVEVDIASEYRYRDPVTLPDTLVIIISQSGETADTLAAMREAKQRGGKVLAITNVVGSSVAREADYLIYTWAGLEIAVASTKAYTSQLMVLYALCAEFARQRGVLSGEEASGMFEKLLGLSEQAEEAIAGVDEIQRFASEQFDRHSVFFLGRGLDYALAMEASLKLKEISYIHSEAYAAGELKHGTIALIEEGTLVVAMATQQALVEKTISNIKEVKVRGAYVLAVAMEGDERVAKEADEVWYIPKTDDFIAPVLAILPMQLFAYYMALQRGCDIDKPRNLAKSVTVE
jgi:glucosamine--fructose-6-phosphate aminotransferase (isomerizing)